MSRSLVLAAIVICIFVSGCSKLFQNPFSSGDDDDDGRPSAQPNRVIEPTAKFSVAIGGVAPGRDELVIYDNLESVRDFTGHTLECAPDDPIVILRPRPDFDSLAAGSGAKIVATDAGVTAIRCTVDGEEMENSWEVTVPPQYLIQIFVAEAGQQIAEEANLDSDNNVKLDSQSKTANALGAVIRNRINMINTADDPELFSADVLRYDIEPPASYYDEVITAPGQFSPTSPQDITHDTFENAQDRNFLDGEWLTAYDQAVLAAAGIFNGDIADLTGGSFAFFSPTEEEWNTISLAWNMNYTAIPEGAGFSDANFPSLAPIQLLIHPDVWKYADGRPAFVFARMRSPENFAIVNTP